MSRGVSGTLAACAVGMRALAMSGRPGTVSLPPSEAERFELSWVVIWTFSAILESRGPSSAILQ
jgi:hypothetical protein